MITIAVTLFFFVNHSCSIITQQFFSRSCREENRTSQKRNDKNLPSFPEHPRVRRLSHDKRARSFTVPVWKKRNSIRRCPKLLTLTIFTSSLSLPPHLHPRPRLLHILIVTTTTARDIHGMCCEAKRLSYHFIARRSYQQKAELRSSLTH